MHPTLRHMDPLRALDAVFEWDLVLLEDEAQTSENGLRVDAVPIVRADADLRVAGDGGSFICRARRREGTARLPCRVLLAMLGFATVMNYFWFYKISLGIAKALGLGAAKTKKAA